MNRSEAIEFLRKHQPLPDDGKLTESLATTLDEVRMYLADNRTPEAIPLLLGVFGDGDGYGVYPLIEDTLVAHDARDVIPHLICALRSGSRAVRYWSAQIASRFPDDQLVAPLEDVLRSGDFDLRYAAVTALDSNPSPAARATLRSWLEHETEPELKDALDDILSPGV
jgi:HEAT repeats